MERVCLVLGGGDMEIRLVLAFIVLIQESGAPVYFKNVSHAIHKEGHIALSETTIACHGDGIVDFLIQLFHLLCRGICQHLSEVAPVGDYFFKSFCKQFQVIVTGIDEGFGSKISFHQFKYHLTVSRDKVVCQLGRFNQVTAKCEDDIGTSLNELWSNGKRQVDMPQAIDSHLCGQSFSSCRF